MTAVEDYEKGFQNLSQRNMSHCLEWSGLNEHTALAHRRGHTRVVGIRLRRTAEDVSKLQSSRQRLRYGGFRHTAMCCERQNQRCKLLRPIILPRASRIANGSAEGPTGTCRGRK